MAFAKEYFAKLLGDLDLVRMEQIYKRITQHLLFNLFTIEEDVEVCVAFETMNNRGKPLSYLELLKNRLIYLSLKIRAEESEKRKLRSSINDCWRTVYHELGRNKLNPLDDDEFLSNHFITYFGKEAIEGDNMRRTMYSRYYRGAYSAYLLEKKFITKNVLSKSGEAEHVSLKNLHDYVQSLQLSVETWYYIFNPLDSPFDADTKMWLDKLTRIGPRLWAPLVMVLFQKEKSTSKRVALLRAIERHMFFMLMFEGVGYSWFESYMQMAIDLGKGKVGVDAVIKCVLDFAKSIEGTPDLPKKLAALIKSRGFYEWHGIRYFLFEHNLHLQEGSKTERAKINWPEFTESKEDYITVEHIFPQKIKKTDTYWTEQFKEFNVRERNALCNSLGNLLPLSRPKNSSLQNKPFPDKVDGGRGKSIGFRYGCYSENAVAKEKKWGPSEIVLRGIELLSFLERRWEIKLGDNEDKLRILNLEFILRDAREPDLKRFFDVV